MSDFTLLLMPDLPGNRVSSAIISDRSNAETRFLSSQFLSSALLMLGMNYQIL
jgi:hypothetical protein